MLDALPTCTALSVNIFTSTPCTYTLATQILNIPFTATSVITSASSVSFEIGNFRNPVN